MVLLIVGTLFGLGFMLASHVTQVSRKSKAVGQLEQLGTAVQAHLAEAGALPGSLGEIAARLAPGFVFDAAGLPLDPWSRPYEYQKTTDYAFLLFSYGDAGTNGAPAERIVLGK